MNPPDSLKLAFSGLQPAETASLIATAADVALLVDADGVIRDVSVGNRELADIGQSGWIGRPWAETVTVESRPKIKALLKDAAGTAQQQWRHVNHAVAEGADIPVLYSTIQAGPEGQVVAIGRDLRQFTSIQQRLVSAQQAMQRDYTRLRQLESRYRALFQAVSEPVLIVDASSLKVVEANPAANRLFGEKGKGLFGRAVAECFEQGSIAKLMVLLDSIRGARHTHADPQRLGIVGSGEVDVYASVFRLDNSTLFLIRISNPSTAGAEAEPAARRHVLAALDRAPDAMVVTEPSGRVIYANQSFAEMVQVDSTESVIGESLDRWLGRSGVDLGVMMASLRQGESVRLFPTVIRSRFGNDTSVEISAAAVLDSKMPCLGFTLRDVGRRPQTDAREDSGLSRAVSQLTELVGRVPLKDIVGQTTDLIEQMCIEAALHLTRDNRAAAAEMLGLSRQSLYVKLRRYGFGEPPAESADGAA